jgi:hypothetical protein
VEAAINAARADLPANLRSNPTYRKFNPSDAPIFARQALEKTSHIDDVINFGMTGFYDKRLIPGTKGYGEGVHEFEELQEFRSH